MSPSHLMIVNKEGEVIRTEENIVNIPHSDGIYALKDVRWVDDVTIAVETLYQCKDQPHDCLGEAFVRLGSPEIEYEMIPYVEWKHEKSVIRLHPEDEQFTFPEA